MTTTRSTTKRSGNVTRGIALIFTAGILTVLAAVGMAFFAMSRSSTMSAVRYSDMVRADLLARAGIHDAIARLREQAFTKTEDPSDPWFMTNYMNNQQTRFSFIAKTSLGKDLPYSRALGSSVTDQGDRFTLQIQDAASKININAGDNLAVILDNLCRLVGPPLVAADLNAIQPRRWAIEGATAGLYDNTLNALDTKTDKKRDLYYRLDDNGRPLDAIRADSDDIWYNNKVAIYGDGYAIAGYRARNGRFGALEELRQALTYVERNGNDKPDDMLEQLEIEVKFRVLKEYLTTDSWVDTTTVGVGKFEWVWDDTVPDARVPGASGTDTDPAAGTTVNVYDLQGIESGTLQCQILIDRDKSWIADDPVNDPLNQRGSLRGAYVSIMNGHGAGQLRRIATNGTDWIALRAYDPDEQMTVPPGPISSYLIMAREDALLELVANTTPPTYVPRVRSDGSMPDDPAVDYAVRPLCIHRSPVNINTASDKVLAALFMGIDVQHGHPMAVGTDAEWPDVVPKDLPAPPVAADSPVWKSKEYTSRSLEPYLLTMKGLKRVPADSGKVVFDRGRPAQAPSPTYDYIDNCYSMPYLNAAQELAHRIIVARQATDWDGAALGADPYVAAYPRGPFKNYDDLYFRVVKPWDDARDAGTKVSVARLIMANFNSNTDILKFNPGIEWIDRFGRNFTEMEPVMVYDDNTNEPRWDTSWLFNYTVVYKLFKDKGCYSTRSLRYKADDLIDKTDLNRSTTEFAFDSGGIYEIVSTGQVFGQMGLLAERKMETLVKVYDVWRESTQEQFARGRISEASSTNQYADGPVTDPNRSGRIVRDGWNTSAPFKRLALDTWPEPLVPLGYTVPAGGTGNTDLVSAKPYDAWQNEKSSGVPDVVSNRVLPARYDGQIALATNTSKYDHLVDKDTFLASFDGDLDTGTCKGNGREQAKSPDNYKIRVLDTISLLGLLNDTEVDFDPAPKPVFVLSLTTPSMQALDANKYWHNVTCRMGDLRPEGVHLGNVGGSGRDATIKYRAYDNLPCGWLGSNNFQLAVRMWMKPNWHLGDGREHEFFNADNPGEGSKARGCEIVLYGKFTGAYASPYGDGSGGRMQNNLQGNFQDEVDSNHLTQLHGGIYNVLTNTSLRESPSYRVQPFRWHYVGAMHNYDYVASVASSAAGYYETSGSDPKAVEWVTNSMRTFIDTARDPEGPDWKPRFFWSSLPKKVMSKADIGNPAVNATSYRQLAAWNWQSSITPRSDQAVFSINNLNDEAKRWIYRVYPVDGTQAVVDELKLTVTKVSTGKALANEIWVDERIEKEMTTSRYYLPVNPADQTQQPTFTSQTLLSSLRGSTSQEGDEVTVVRVSWNCFTPRFMHDNKRHQPVRKRDEAIGDMGVAPTVQSISYRGPFDYIQYNFEILPAPSSLYPQPGEAKRPEDNIDPNGLNPRCEYPADSGIFPLDCQRPARKDYPVDAESGIQQAHASKGIEVELIEDSNGIPEITDKVLLEIIPGDRKGTFTNPDGRIDPANPTLPPMNRLGDSQNPIRVKSGQLRYRVRFKYPVDHFVQKIYSDGATVDPNKHYMVDTPVFDDISVTYFTKTRILSYREVTE